MRHRELKRWPMACWVLLAAAALLPRSAAAGNGFWSTGGPYGGPIYALAVAPSSPSVVYAAAAGTLFRSTDSGTSWVDTGLAHGGRELAVHPSASGTVYVAGFDGIFKSTDAGSSWVRLPQLTPPIWGLALDPVTPATVYVALSDAVFKSTDSGASWASANSGLELGASVLAVSPSASTTVYAGTGAGVYKSTNAGATWSPARGGIESLGIHCLAIDPTSAATAYAGSPSGAFRTTDGGASWSPLDLGLAGPDVRALAIDPLTPTTAYAATTAGAYKSTDSGGSWAPVGSGLTDREVGLLAIDPSSPATVYAGGLHFGVFRSSDAGSTWAPTNTGLAGHSIGAVASPQQAPATVYAGTWGAGFFRSTDAGGSWTAASAGLANANLVYPDIVALAVDPATPATVYAGHSGGVFKTTDAGDSWQPAMTGLPTTWVAALALHPSEPSTIYAGTLDGAFKSTDAGGHWFSSGAGLPGWEVRVMVIDPSTPSTLYAAGGGGVYRSTDAGASWSYRGSPGSTWALAIDPGNLATLYAATDLDFFRSTDGGSSWSLARSGLPLYAELAGPLLVPRPATLFTTVSDTTRAGLYQSSDGAGSWRPARAGLPAVPSALALGGGEPFTVYAGGRASVWQATSPPVFVKGDLDRDGQTDLVFRSTVDGRRNTAWLMNGVARASAAAIVPDAVDAGWTIRGVDDFDRDGRNDLVFWNRATGAVEFWLMNGVVRIGPPVPLSGGAVLDPGWELAATGDHHYPDGKPDLVWRNATSQKLVIWKMDGTRKVEAVIPAPSQAVDGNWAIVATADYDDDSYTDFLWYNQTSGKIVTWYMDASVVRTSGQFTSPANAGDNNWKVVASGDYSGAAGPGTPPLGSPDIVWRNETSGNQVVWHMDFASTRVHGEFTNPTANTPALDWTIVGPR